ncbi:hypothetical protein [Paenibacillus alkalitolerans]|uniref:hypothetical protein n=1 Tax=Paenibacillus alkalitolerans TaxID=2799335 RepID=UPI0018F71F6E|nr:hypothetical protein [Paenibacillus alkalitolerans]
MPSTSIKSRNFLLFISICLFALIAGCGSDLHRAISAGDVDNVNDSGTAQGDTEVEDVAFHDFIIPESYRLKRKLVHAAGEDSSYILYEYETEDYLPSINEWLRHEAKRLGGKVIERYSFDSKSSIDIMIEFPSKTGTRLISTYTPKYMDKQHVVIEETLFTKPLKIDQDYEDHALVIFTPDKEGNMTESFKGEYFHQHTDVFVVYFFSQAFLQELVEAGKYGITEDDIDYAVGYFDKNGEEIDPYSIGETNPLIAEENRDKYTFGIQLKKDFLPAEPSQREKLLYAWAKTVLTGDKAVSHTYDGTETINFLIKGGVFKTYSLKELAD